MDEAKIVLSRLTNDMKKFGYSVIVNTIDEICKSGNNVEDIFHDSVVQLQNHFSSFDSSKLENLLIKIGNENAKLAYCYSFFMHSNINDVTANIQSPCG